MIKNVKKCIIKLIQIKIMRKVVFVLALVLFTGTVSFVNAQDIITKRVDGSEIRAKVLEVGVTDVRYKLFDNQDGPDYVLPKSDIFRIKYADGRIEMFDATPPASPATNTTVATPPKQSRVPVAATPYQGDWESQMRATAPGIYQRYRKGSRQSKVGLGLVIGGTAAFITGAAIMGSVVEDNTVDENDLGTVGAGAIVYITGAICATVGTPIMIVGYVRKGKAKREYFSQYANRPYAQKSPLQSPHFEVRTNGIAFVF
jgi:hypothetical protein